MQSIHLRPLRTDAPGLFFPGHSGDCPVEEIRYDFDRHGIGAGGMRVHPLADALVTVVDGRLDRDMHHLCVAESDVLIVRASISSDCRYAADDRVCWDFRRPGLTVSALPKGAHLEIHVGSEAAQRAVTLVIEPRSLIASLDFERGSLPAPLQDTIDAPMSRASILAALPMRAEAAGLVDDLAHSRLSGSLRRMQVRGRCVELMALLVAEWTMALDEDRWAGARHRDGALVASARRILSDRYVDPPTMQELASLLGTNKNKLNQLFQQRLGITPQAFCQRRRIERAQALIVEGRLNVGQVADAVGYQHQSSFTVAFRGLVGMSPREFARRQSGVGERPSMAMH